MINGIHISTVHTIKFIVGFTLKWPLNDICVFEIFIIIIIIIIIIGFKDRHYQNTSSVVSASWHGFVDLGSSLRSYHWCVSTSASVGACNVLSSEVVGLVTKAERKLSTTVTNGMSSHKYHNND